MFLTLSHFYLFLGNNSNEDLLTTDLENQNNKAARVHSEAQSQKSRWIFMIPCAKIKKFSYKTLRSNLET